MATDIYSELIDYIGHEIHTFTTEPNKIIISDTFMEAIRKQRRRQNLNEDVRTIWGIPVTEERDLNTHYRFEFQ